MPPRWRKPNTYRRAACASGAPVTPPTGGTADEVSIGQSVPQELEPEREGSDWFAVFNPDVKRQLDINLVHSLPHKSYVCCVQISQDGKYLATGGSRMAHIFDSATGQKIRDFYHESGNTGDLYVRSLRFSPDGKYLATAAEDRMIRIWDITYGCLQTYEGHQQEVYSLEYSLDGRFLVSGSGDGTVRIWDLLERTCGIFNDINVAVVDLNTDRAVTSVAISPRADLVAAGCLDNVVRIWDVESGGIVQILRGHDDAAYSIAFTRDGMGLVSGSLDKTLKLWDVSHLGPNGDRGRHGNGPPPHKDFLGHKDFVLSVSVPSDGRWVVSGSKDRTMCVWDLATGEMQLQVDGHKNSVISVALNSEHGLVATGGGDNVARIWKLTNLG